MRRVAESGAKGVPVTLRVVLRRLDRVASLHCWTADPAGQDAGALHAEPSFQPKHNALPIASAPSIIDVRSGEIYSSHQLFEQKIQHALVHTNRFLGALLVPCSLAEMTVPFRLVY